MLLRRIVLEHFRGIRLEVLDLDPTTAIITTNSGELLAGLPLRSIRRLFVEHGHTPVRRTHSEHYSIDDLGRIAYHVRINRAGALFVARC